MLTLSKDKRTHHIVVSGKGKARGLEEGHESRKLGDDKLVPQLGPMLAVGTVLTVFLKVAL